MSSSLYKLIFLFVLYYAGFCSSTLSQSVLNRGSFSQTDFEIPNLLPGVISLFNSKSVDREEIQKQHLSAGVWLNYRIRFQNDGSGFATNIRIKDSLSSFLDFNTFQFAGSSHQGQFVLYTSGNLYINYLGINLPDSTMDFIGSQGSFRFRIQPKENLPVSTAIFNTAEIQFDLGSPIVTNTVQTDIINYSSISILNLNHAITIYPNPASDNITVRWYNELEVSDLQVIDVTGKILFEQNPLFSINESIIIDLTSLAKGFYFLKINHQHGVSLIKIKRL